MTTAERLSELLADRGVHEVFGNPGTTELPFLEGASHQRYYLTLHDALAVGAADGFAQSSRRASVANLHAAPGLGNSIAFIETAAKNRSPVVLTVGQQDQRHIDQRPLLYGDMGARVSGLVKYFLEVRAPSELATAVDRAFRTALEPPSGPVLLSLPMDVMEAPADDRPPDVASASERTIDVRAVADRLRSAKRPALVVGYEVDVFDAFDEVRALAERLGAPVFAEPICSRAPVPEALDSFVGDLLPATPLIASALGDHDLVALVGADLTLYPYMAAPQRSGGSLVYLGADASVPAKLGCERALGDLRLLLRAVLAEVPSTGRRFRRPPDLARANRIARAETRLGPEFVVDAIRRAFRGHTVVDESVSFVPTMKSAGFYAGPLSYFASRSQQLGWGLAATVGIALNRPKTVCVLGDGALQYSVQALWTLARYRIPAKVVVLNNGGYSILKSYAKANHPGVVGAAYRDLPDVDVVGLAKAFGVPASTVGTSAQLDRALLELAAENGPALLNVDVDRTVPDLFS